MKTSYRLSRDGLRWLEFDFGCCVMTDLSLISMAKVTILNTVFWLLVGIGASVGAVGAALLDEASDK